MKPTRLATAMAKAMDADPATEAWAQDIIRAYVTGCRRADAVDAIRSFLSLLERRLAEHARRVTYGPPSPEKGAK